MLIPNACGLRQIRSAYIININMVLHTAFALFVDLNKNLVLRLYRESIGRRTLEYQV